MFCYFIQFYSPLLFSLGSVLNLFHIWLACFYGVLNHILHIEST